MKCVIYQEKALPVLVAPSTKKKKKNPNPKKKKSKAGAPMKGAAPKPKKAAKPAPAAAAAAEAEAVVESKTVSFRGVFFHYRRMTEYLCNVLCIF